MKKEFILEEIILAGVILAVIGVLLPFIFPTEFSELEFISSPAVIDENAHLEPEAETISENIDLYAECMVYSSTFAANKCYAEKAISLKDISGCEKTFDNYENDCYKEYALATSDDSACEKISDDSIKWECYSELGEKINSADLCLKIPAGKTTNDLKGNCLRNIALKTKTPELCLKIDFYYSQEVLIRDDCIKNFVAKVTNEKLCEVAYEKSLKNSCYENLAKNTLDLEFCSKITETDKIAEKAEMDECYYYLGVQKNLLDACSFISAKEKQLECKEKYIAPTPEECELHSTLFLKNNCFKDFAIVDSNSYYCELITSDFSIQSECYKNLAEKTTDYNYCEKIYSTNKSMKDDCYSNIAIETKTSDLCENVLVPKKYIDCFIQIADSLNEVSVCNSIEKEKISTYSIYKLHDICVHEYSLIIDDTKYCARITNETIRNECFDLNTSITLK